MSKESRQEYMTTILKKWHDNAKNYEQNESAIDNMHGAWICAINMLDDSIELRKIIDHWQDKCKARRNEFRGDL